MYREIKKKKVILENRNPYKPEVAALLREMDILDWISSSLHLDGINIPIEDIRSMIRGNITMRATLEEHAIVGRYVEAIKKATSLASIHHSIDKQQIMQFYGILTGEDTPRYRKGNPVLLALHYNPPHPSEISEQIDALLSWLSTDKDELNVIMKAAILHNRFIRIYPFDNGSEMIARFLMYYYLLLQGYPPFMVGMTESEYNNQLSLYFKTGYIQPFYDVLEKGLYNKIGVIMQLTTPD